MAVIRDVMPTFELFQPTSVADAQTLLAQHGQDAWVLAGGMDSFDWLKDRIKRPKVVVDLSGIEALKGIKTVNELGSEYAVHPTQISQWKRQLQAGAKELLSKHLSQRRARSGSGSSEAL